jgi:RNA polymerase sigma factor (sigma-70 family)
VSDAGSVAGDDERDDERDDDRALVDRVVGARDEAAFRALYRRHTPRLFALAVRLTGDRADAEDAVHDAWVRAADALGGFAWRSSLATWLAGVLVNRVRELRRARRRELPADDADAAALADALTNGAVDGGPLPGDADRLDLERAIAALAPRYREVLVLHDVEGFTHEEIGALLGIEPGTSKSQLARARDRVRRALAPEGGRHRA